MNFLSNLTGCFAYPAAENPTVAMVEAAYQHHKMDWRYINCELSADQLGAAVRGAKAMGWKGFNCSLPHKIAVIDHIDAVGPSAKIIGAVNCVVLRDGKFVGENTDGKGFVKSLDGVTTIPGKRMVILGAGGAARAIAVEMALAGVSQIEIVNRSAEPGNDLAALINKQTQATATYRGWTDQIEIADDVDILVNATSIGLYPDVTDMPIVNWTNIPQGLVVADVIPNPPETIFLKSAAAHGCVTVNGLGMLVNQGVIGIEYWTGKAVDSQVMQDKLAEIFGP